MRDVEQGQSALSPTLAMVLGNIGVAERVVQCEGHCTLRSVGVWGDGPSGSRAAPWSFFATG